MSQENETAQILVTIVCLTLTHRKKPALQGVTV